MSPRRRGAAAALLGAAAACGGGPLGPPADLAAVDPQQVPALVLAACHGPLQSRMGRLAAEVALPDGALVRAFAELPDRLRTSGARGQWLWLAGELHALGQGPAPGAADREFVAALRELLDAAALGPLYRCRGPVERAGERAFLLPQPDGSRCRLELHAGTLLPARLGGPDGAVEVREHLATGTTWIARRVHHPRLGECTLRFDLAGVEFAADFFRAPAARAGAPARTTLPLPGGGAGEVRSAVPVLLPQRALQLVVLDDPGDWAARAAAVQPVHRELERQQQQIAGFPWLWREAGQDRLAVPFRRRSGGPEFAAPAGWQLRAHDDGRALVVYPPDGDFAARTAAGTAQLQAALAQQGLQAAGEVVAQPFLHLDEAAPTAAQLQAPVVRLSLRVR